MQGRKNIPGSGNRMCKVPKVRKYGPVRRHERSKDGEKSKAHIMTSLYVVLRSMAFILNVIGRNEGILNRGAT